MAIDYAIITPTYRRHFWCIKNYLKSYIRYVNSGHVPIYFIISREEIDEFKKVLEPYQFVIDMNVLLFEDILDSFNISIPVTELLEKYGRFTFQTMKKMYGMLHIDADRFLVLDSESMWVNPVNMRVMFDDFFSAPFISGTNLQFPFRKNAAFGQLCANIDTLLAYTCERWFLENFMWFYDKSILSDLFTAHGSLMEMAERIYYINDGLTEFDRLIKNGIFEIALYQNFIYRYHKKYGYRVIDIDAELSQALSHKELNNYEKNFYKSYDGGCGLVEHAMCLLTKCNVQPIAEMFYRLHFNIIRCDYTKDYILQKKFISIAKPAILAASQNHAFGVHANLKGFLRLLRLAKGVKKIAKFFRIHYFRQTQEECLPKTLPVVPRFSAIKKSPFDPVMFGQFKQQYDYYHNIEHVILHPAFINRIDILDIDLLRQLRTRLSDDHELLIVSDSDFARYSEFRTITLDQLASFSTPEGIRFCLCFDRDWLGRKAVQMLEEKGLGYYTLPKTLPSSRFMHVDEHAYETFESEFQNEPKLHYSPLDFEDIFQAIQATRDLEGDYVEFGSYEGSSVHAALNYMQRIGLDRKVYFFDACAGFNYEDDRNSNAQSLQWTYADPIQESFSFYTSSYENVNIRKLNCIKEMIPDEIKSISCININIDMYGYVKYAIYKFKDKLIQNGIMMIENYGHTPYCLGVQKAVHEFLDENRGQFTHLMMRGSHIFLIKRYGGSENEI